MRFFAHIALAIILVIGILISAHITPAPVQAQEPAIQHTIREHTIGFSVQGRPITALQIGNGWRKLVVVGDTHGGPESNTYWLTLELMDHFRTNPHEVPPDIRLYLIPTLNPDGLELWSRYNANGVDLNRNMNTNLDACPENDWSTTVYGAGGVVSNTGGPYPDSEVESQIIRSFLLDASGAIFLHSNAGLVFPAYCEHQPSIHMAQVYAETSGYVYSRYWPNYMINGGMHDWAASVGVASIIPELVTATSTEFAQNLAGVQAVMAQTPNVLPPPQDHMVGQFIVLAPIWRYWIAHGGEHVFGLPIESPQPTANGFVQTFTNVRLEMRYSLADTPLLVQTAPLGVENLQRDRYAMPEATPQTQHPPPPDTRTN